MTKKDENMTLEESCLYPDHLELGLSLGVGNAKFKDFPSSSSSSSTKSSENSSPLANTAASNQVVGWPPIRAYRMNSMVNQIKFSSADDFQPTVEKCKNKNDDRDTDCDEGDKNYIVNMMCDEGKIKKSNFVKVNKDGNGIGRKVDLGVHSCYETLAQTIQEMFSGAGTTKRSSVKEHDSMITATGSSRLFDGSSEFVLTYEDNDGDWMLVGDVPWGMFVNSVKRLKIMRTAEANGLGSKFEVNASQNLPI